MVHRSVRHAYRASNAAERQVDTYFSRASRFVQKSIGKEVVSKGNCDVSEIAGTLLHAPTLST